MSYANEKRFIPFYIPTPKKQPKTLVFQLCKFYMEICFKAFYSSVYLTKYHPHLPKKKKKIQYIFIKPINYSLRSESKIYKNTN